MEIPVEDIKQWRGHDVVDADGRRLGMLVEILYDTRTDTPAFAVVRSGPLGRRRVRLVPLVGARAGQAHLRVTIDKSVFKDAPSLPPERELTAEDEVTAYEYYGLDYPREQRARLLAKH